MTHRKTAGPYAVEGVSVAGLETCLHLPQLRLLLDAGRCPEFAVGCATVLLTHGHNDHVAGLPYHAAARALGGHPPPTYYVPEDILEDVRDMLIAHGRLDRAALRFTLAGVRAGVEFPHPTLKGLSVVPFAAHHRVPTLGYRIYRTVQKLRAEYADLTNAERAALAREGTAITEPVRTLEVAFTGDTRATVFDAEPDLYRARLLITECSFAGTAMSPEGAASRGHVHLDELVARGASFANEAILLTHFSARYGMVDLARARQELAVAAPGTKTVTVLHE